MVVGFLIAFAAGSYFSPMVVSEVQEAEDWMQGYISGFENTTTATTTTATRTTHTSTSLTSTVSSTTTASTTTASTTTTSSSTTQTTTTQTTLSSTRTVSTITKTTTHTTFTKTSRTTTSRTWTTTAYLPLAPYDCISDQFLGPVKKTQQKGLALDDTTFHFCPELPTVHWPNAKENITSIRLFKAWDEQWTADRTMAWIKLRRYVRGSNVKVLYGTQISCNETADDMDWLYVKELMVFIGQEHVMGVAIGNEVELLHTQQNVSKECIDKMFVGGYFYKKVIHRADDLSVMPGFNQVTLTTVMGGFVLGGAPFVNTREAQVLDFFTKINADFGRRWAWSWNTYPYFDPHIVMDKGPFKTCSSAMMAAINFAPSSMLPSQLRVLRTRMQQVTGRPDDTMWLTETGWSYPRASTLSTVMKECKEWSTVEALSLYYQAFLEWDLGLGANVQGVDHAFYFTLRDSINFGDKENFGLIRGCGSRGCKLRHH